MPAEHAIRGANGTTTSVREADPQHFFFTQAMGGELVSSEGRHHQYRIGDEQGYGRQLELAEEPDLQQGTWQFGEGTIHHHAFDVVSAANQQEVKDWIVGLGVHRRLRAEGPRLLLLDDCRSPGGLLVEIAYGTPQGFTIDESEEELGTHMCIPPHWEDRRSEISQLEPIETIETVVG